MFNFIINLFNFIINLLDFKKVLGCFDAFNQTCKSVFNLIGIWFYCCKINTPISRIMGINP
nr:hypothetical protein [Helicobacter pylori]